MREKFRRVWSRDPAPLLRNLIGAWEFEDGSNLGLDGWANGLNLTNNNSVTQQVPGVVGNGAAFDAASTQNLSRANTALLQTGNIDYTWAFWFNVLTGSPSSYLISKSISATTGDYDLSITAGNGLQFVTFSGAASKTASIPTNNANAGWVFGMVWHDTTAVTMNMRRNATEATPTAQTLTPAVSTATLRLGCKSGLTSPLTGYMDQVCFWKRVVRSLERSWLYNNALGRSVEEMKIYSFFQVLLWGTLDKLNRRGVRLPRPAVELLPRIPARYRGAAHTRRPSGLYTPEYAR